MRSKLPVIARLLAKRKLQKCPDKTLEGDCWIWTGTKMPNGYGQIGVNNASRLVHRVSFTLANGPIIEGMEVDHLCAIRDCFNPDHLEQVTHQINVARGNGGKRARETTHCPKGHPYDKENTRYAKYRSGKIKRVCRTCESARKKERRKRIKQLSIENH